MESVASFVAAVASFYEGILTEDLNANVTVTFISQQVVIVDVVNATGVRRELQDMKNATNRLLGEVTVTATPLTEAAVQPRDAVQEALVTALETDETSFINDLRNTDDPFFFPVFDVQADSFAEPLGGVTRSEMPSVQPSEFPSIMQSQSPSTKTTAPSASPSNLPSEAPLATTTEPSTSLSPSTEPSVRVPSAFPSHLPSEAPLTPSTERKISRVPSVEPWGGSRPCCA